MSQPALLVESVTRRFGEVVAVDDVTLSVSPGEVYGLIGANGAGKSTLIRMIVGITRPDSGRVLIFGEQVSDHLPGPRRRLGYLPEELIFYERLTGREYLELVAGLKGSERSSISEEIEFFELAGVDRKLVGGYSLGMRKKLGLAAAMIGSPDISVLDEPLNGLDVEMMRKLRLRIEAQRAAGKIIIVSSHVMSFVERICGRVGVMRDGRLVAEGTPKELRIQSGLTSEPFEDVFFHLASPVQRT